MGVPRSELPTWDDLQVLTAQLATRPLDEDAEVDSALVIGPRANRPLHLEIPIFVSDMSFGALSEEAKVTLARGAELALAALARARAHLDRRAGREVTLIITGGLRTAPDFFKAMALGADGVAIANSAIQAPSSVPRTSRPSTGPPPTSPESPSPASLADPEQPPSGARHVGSAHGVTVGMRARH